MTRRGPDSGAEALRIDPEATERILTGFLRTELRRTGRERLVVGLSGGLDSAVSAFLAARAIGASNVVCVRMPYRSSSPASLEDAQLVIDALGTPAETFEITPLVDGFVGMCGDVGAMRLGNVMSRTRMLTLFDRSEEHGALVLGTSNKSELLLGYGTLFGDMASALNPLGDLYKTQVSQLAEHLGVPEPIRTKPPSADLWPDQSDEDELGFRYETVDRLLVLMVDARVSRRKLIGEGFSEAFVDQVRRTLVRSQFKRRPPVIAKISTRSIDWDFRYPRDWES